MINPGKKFIFKQSIFMKLELHIIMYLCIKIRNYDSVKISKNWRNMKQ